jgi:hypothetical protein
VVLCPSRERVQEVEMSDTNGEAALASEVLAVPDLGLWAPRRRAAWEDGARRRAPSTWSHVGENEAGKGGRFNR